MSSTIKCRACNLVNWSSVDACKRCGATFGESEGAAPEVPQIVEANTAEPPAPAQDRVETPVPVPVQPAFVRPAPPPYTFSPVTEKKKIGLAVFSMIAGIVGVPPISSVLLLLVGGLLALMFGVGGFIAGAVIVLAVIPVGLITGIVALRRANRSPNMFGGKGLAITGIACSSFGLVIVPLVAAIAIPNLLAARRAANEGAAIRTIGQLARAENMFIQDEIPAGLCGDMDALADLSLIDPALARSGEKSGYRFVLVSMPTGGCEIHATPMSPSMGTRSFYYSTNEGEIRAAARQGKQADRFDPLLDDESPAAGVRPTKVAQKGIK
jgi:hypothetical protein